MLAPGRHYIGDPIRLAVNYSTNGTDVDPTGVTLRVRDPNGIVTEYVYGTDADVVLTDAGDYLCDFIPDQSGRWSFRWVSSGTNTTSALEGEFLVQRSPFYDTTTRLYG